MSDPATFGEVLELVSSAVIWGALFSAIPLLASMSIGLVVGALQAATQIQEPSLSFVPKLFGVIVALWLTGGWIWESLVAFSIESFGR